MTRAPAGNTKINIYFPEQVLEVLRVMARKRGTTYSELIREACRGYALKEGPKVAEESKAIRELAR
jgi:metal-responsive CopG/Arc/MetJ family transcriptional regulator